MIKSSETENEIIGAIGNASGIGGRRRRRLRRHPGTVCPTTSTCGVVPAAGGTTPLEGDDADDRLRTLGADHDLARRHHSPTSVLLFKFQLISPPQPEDGCIMTGRIPGSEK